MGWKNKSFTVWDTLVRGSDWAGRYSFKDQVPSRESSRIYQHNTKSYFNVPRYDINRVPMLLYMLLYIKIKQWYITKILWYYHSHDTIVLRQPFEHELGHSKRAKITQRVIVHFTWSLSVQGLHVTTANYKEFYSLFLFF